jgi:hypothetical protein
MSSELTLLQGGLTVPVINLNRTHMPVDSVQVT